MARKRRNFKAAFKAKVALEAVKERYTLAELSTRYQVHSNMISKWKKTFSERAPEIFETPAPEKENDKLLESLYTKIGKLEMELDWLKKISNQT